MKDTSAVVMFKAVVPDIETGSNNLPIVKLVEALFRDGGNKAMSMEIFLHGLDNYSVDTPIKSWLNGRAKHRLLKNF